MKEGKYFEMDVKVYLRRLTSLFLCCVLVFSSIPVQVHASDPVTAATLAITGGQLAGAGLSGEAALSLAGPVGAVVGVTLGALGINAYVSKAAQEAGKTRTRFVLDKLVLWGAQAGYTKEQIYSKIAEGISVAVDGTIQLGTDVANTIQQFGNWLVSEDGEVVPSIESTSVYTYGDMTLPVLAAGATAKAIDTGSWSLTLTNNGTEPIMLIKNAANDLQVVSFGNVSGTIFVQRTNDSSFNSSYYTELVLATNGAGTRLFETYGGIPSYGHSQYFTSLVLPDNFLSYFASTSFTPVFSEESAHDEVFVGNPQDWAENKDVLNPAGDTPVTLNPDLLNPIIDSLADGQQATMSIIDYLQALQDAWDHALDDVQTAIGTITDTLTGIQEQIAVPQDAVENPTVTNPSVTPDTTPILNPSDVDPGTAITGLSFDLTNIFPFCIPFDIYAALNLLDAEPVAPSYHFHLEWPYNIIIDFTIDLSPFNQVAAVARTMETLIFIIGLAVMTRSMFIRG